jgi:hypothetical protein
MKTLGLERYCLDIIDISYGQIFPLVIEIIENSATIRTKIQNNVSQIRQEIEPQLEKSLRAFLKNKT